MKKYFCVLVLIVFCLLSCEKQKVSEINQRTSYDAMIPASEHDGILSFDSVCNNFELLGYKQVEVGNNFQDRLHLEGFDDLRIYCHDKDTFCVFNYSGTNKVQYLPEQKECDKELYYQLDKNKSIVGVSCQGNGKHCRIDSDENGDITIIICR